MMASDMGSETEYKITFREDEELEFFTELALHETERWIQAVTKKSLQYPDDTRKSLEDGILLCQLLNCLKPGSVPRINKLPTPIAGLDNINQFLQACKHKFGLNDVYLFNPSDLEDLSRRAIAESISLKQEYEKRLRNVAVTIYWLGKFASQHFCGPQLDHSAFSALVHHRQEPEIVERTFLSHHHHHHHQEPVSAERRFTSENRTSSCNSCGLSTESSPGYNSNQIHVVSRFCEIDDIIDDDRHDSMSTQSRGQGHATTPTDRHSTSSLDLGQGGVSHRRYSSTDSMDSSGQSCHSHPGLDNQEISYPTRRSNSQASRKSSASDPLQFIKSRGGQELAHTAQVQIRVAAESRHGSAQVRAQDDDANWQNELSSWKSRRKSQSERAYHLRDELELSQEEKIRSSGKQGKITKKKFYPIKDYDDDDDDDVQEEDVFASSGNRDKQILSATVNIQPSTIQARDSSEEVSSRKINAGFGDEEDETFGTKSKYDTNNNVGLGRTSEKEKETSLSLQSLVHKSFTHDDDVGTLSKVDYNKDVMPPSSSHGSATNLKGPGSESLYQAKALGNESIYQTKALGNESIYQNMRPLKTFSEMENWKYETTDKEKPVISSSNDRTKQDGSEVSSSNERTEQDGSEIQGFHNFGSRTQRKIASILNNFEGSSVTKSAPKQGYNENVDVQARKSMFEKVAVLSQHFSAADSNSSEDELKEIEAGKSFMPTETLSSSQAPPISAAETASSAVAVAAASSPLIKNRNSPMAAHKTSADPSNNHFQALNNPVRKKVKISQKANSERGFGFFLSGGVDQQTSLFVSKVSLGSAADVCDLKVGDVIVALNQTDVSAMSTHQVEDIISSAVASGFIEIEILREQEDDDIEEFTSSSDEGEEEITKTENVQAHSPREKEEALSFTENTKVFVDSGFGPPDILKKWQSQRQKEEYTYKDNVDLGMKITSGQTEEYSPTTMRYETRSPNNRDIQETDLTGWCETMTRSPRHNDIPENVVPRHHKAVTTSPPSNHRQHKAVTTSQLSNHRQHEDIEPDLSINFLKKDSPWNFEAEDGQMERERARLTEERRMERRARILQTSASSQLVASPQHNETTSHHELRSSSLAVIVPSQNRRIYTGFYADQQDFSKSTPANRGMTGNESTTQPANREMTATQFKNENPAQKFEDSGIVIDSRVAALIEGEREKIRKEELLKIEELRKRTEEELKNREEEEIKRIQREEEELMKEKEMIQLEKEKLQREKQEFERLKELQQQHRYPQQQNQQQQQETNNKTLSLQQVKYHPQKSDNILPSLESDHSTLEPEHSNILSITSRSSVSGLKNTRTDPGAQTQTQSQQQQQQLQQQQHYHKLFGHNVQLRNDAQEYADVDVCSGNTKTRAPRGDSPGHGSRDTKTRTTRGDLDDTTDGQRLTREEMLAMNRTSKPMLARPVSSRSDQAHQASGPIIREAPSREEIHFLNSVPKAKLRNDSDWHNSSTTFQTPASSHVQKVATDKSLRHEGRIGKSKISMADPRDHWLVQEAERRRIAEYEGKLDSGHPTVHRPQSNVPIKPAPYSQNLWRQDPVKFTGSSQNLRSEDPGTGSSSSRASTTMSANIKHTLLQKTARERASNSPVHAGYPSLSSAPFQTHYHNQKYSPSSQDSHQHHSPESQYQAHTSALPAADQSQGPQVAVTGSQLCSHCSHELGYGAAMVIESLGLYYHVQCFRCCVCNVSLGTGIHGADVRVRINKLHCPNCYSNDEAGLKLSQV